ncbi:unnamed protein product, partial [Symbiodinium pilosum]
MAVLVAGQDYVILILVCVITLVITGCSHAFVLTTNNNLQAGFAKVGIYIGQFAVAVQVTVVIQRMDIDGRQIVCNYALDNGVLIFVQVFQIVSIDELIHSLNAVSCVTRFAAVLVSDCGSSSGVHDRNAIVALAPILPSTEAGSFLVFSMLCLNLCLTALFQPWLSLLATYIDMLANFALLTILLYGAFYADNVHGPAGVMVCSLVLCSILMIFLSLAVQALAEAWSRKRAKRYDFFLTHHKKSCGSMARWMKLELQQRSVASPCFWTLMTCQIYRISSAAWPTMWTSWLSLLPLVFGLVICPVSGRIWGGACPKEL